MKISDEIRVWCDRKCGCYIDGDVRDDLYALADRIDRETVELPRDKDGESIHIGDAVYDSASGKRYIVKRLHLAEIRGVLWGVPTWGVSAYSGEYIDPAELTHTRPDSLGRIAEDIEAAEDWCDGEGEYGTGVTSVEESTLREWADRIRKLAEKEEE